MKKEKITKMLIIIAAIIVIVVSLTKLSGVNSMSLSEYAASKAAESAESN